MRSLIAQNLVRSLGIILLCAAVLKTHHIYSVPLSKWLAVGFLSQVLAETSFGIWFVGATSSLTKWRCACLCFGMFAIVAAIQTARGVESCGCFGSFIVSPWIILVFDVSAVYALHSFRSRESSSMRQARWMSASLVLIGVGACVLLTIIAMQGQSHLAGSGANSNDSRFVVLNPSEWISKPFSLVDQIKIDGNLSQGEWDVLIYSQGCSVCHRVIAELAQSVRDRATTGQVAIIAIDGAATDAIVSQLQVQENGCSVGYIASEKILVTETPLRVRLEHGVCRRAVVVKQWR